MILPKPAVLWMGIRPKTLSMSLMPVLVAVAYATQQNQSINGLVVLAICLAAVSIQIATNLHNDAQDFVNGTDTKERLGPQRITQSGLATAEQTRNAAFLFLGIAALGGLYLAIIGGLPIILIGLASLFAAYGYSSGPFPLSRGPFGEIFVLIFFGIIAVSGTHYLLTKDWSLTPIVLGFIIGLPACAVLTLNNYRDLQNDVIAGRKTLAILAGEKNAKGLYIGQLLLPYILLPFILELSLTLILPYAGSIVALIAIKKTLSVQDKRELNACLAISAASQTFLCIGLSLYLAI